MKLRTQDTNTARGITLGQLEIARIVEERHAYESLKKCLGALDRRKILREPCLLAIGCNSRGQTPRWKT